MVECVLPLNGSVSLHRLGDLATKLDYEILLLGPVLFSEHRSRLDVKDICFHYKLHRSGLSLFEELNVGGKCRSRKPDTPDGLSSYIALNCVRLEWLQQHLVRSVLTCLVGNPIYMELGHNYLLSVTWTCH